jgi:hypothetical protein
MVTAEFLQYETKEWSDVPVICIGDPEALEMRVKKSVSAKPGQRVC